MSAYEVVEAVIFGAAIVFMAAILLAAFVLSLPGKDFFKFDCYIGAGLKPKAYRNLKLTCRFNGFLLGLLSFGHVIYTPFVAFDPEGGVLIAVGWFVLSSMFLWLSVRFFLWSFQE